MRTRLALISVSLATVVSFSSRESAAWVHICNKTANQIFISYMFEDEGDVRDGCGINQPIDGWASLRGWYAAAPGGCVTVFGGDAAWAQHFYWATDNLGHYWTSSYAAYSGVRVNNPYDGNPYNLCCHIGFSNTFDDLYCMNYIDSVWPNRPHGRLTNPNNANNLTRNLL